MKTTTTIACLSLALCYASAAYADTFGSGPNTFDIEFVHIGDPGNAIDTRVHPNPNNNSHLKPTGSVADPYRIGKFEISEDMIEKANLAGGLGITKDSRGPNQPATMITWYEAATFVNWLNTSTGSTPAYKFDSGGNFQLWQSGDPGFDPDNLYRNSQANYFLPSASEWHKAAYFNPADSTYFDYPTASHSVPDGIDFAGDPNFNAVFFQGGLNPGPNDITNAGTPSPYGTVGQGGNVYEWEETDGDLVNDLITNDRGVRGGNWNNFHQELLASVRYVNGPQNQNNALGFRVASVSGTAPDIRLDVTYSVGAIEDGPLSFGLSALPEEVNATFLLPPSPPAGPIPVPLPNAGTWTTEDVLSATISFGDATWTTSDLESFSLELDDGEISSLTYQFSPINTGTSTGGVILNFPLTITGTDTASGLDFEYQFVSSTETLTPVPGPCSPGDTDNDGDVDTADLTTAITNFTGAGGSGKLCEDGDTDDDGDVDTADLTFSITNFTGAMAGNAGVPDLIYDPATGNVTIDADGADVISFSLQSGPFNAADFSELPAGLTDNIASQIGWTSFNLFSGLTGTANLGAILPAGLNQAALEAALTTASYGLALSGGGGGGRLDIIIPEPISLVIVCASALLASIRRREKHSR